MEKDCIFVYFFYLSINVLFDIFHRRKIEKVRKTLNYVVVVAGLFFTWHVVELHSILN